jgi:nicotinate dehydrogenase subunit B
MADRWESVPLPPATGSDATSALPPHVDSNPVLSRWVRVRPDGVIDVQVGKVELGQGILTALAQVAADGLGVRVDRVHMVPASTDGPDQGVTSGSMSTSHTRPALDLVCGNVRALFIQEAARRWGVEPGDVEVHDGVFRPVPDRDGPGSTTSGATPSTVSASYGALTADVDLDVKADPALRATTSTARSVGHSVARLDLHDKVAGRPAFIHDLRWPEMLFGRVVRPPSPGARLTQVDTAALDGTGVRVVRDGSFLGLVGPSEAEVVACADRLRSCTRWTEHDQLPDDDDLDAFLRSGPHEDIPLVNDSAPDDPAQSLEPVTVVRATYSKPFTAHASIAPSCAAARWEDDGALTVWSHSQGIFRLRDAIAQVVGLDRHLVRIHHVAGAGCYGHNPADDVALDAVLLARAVPTVPVLTQWSRQDELAWDPFGSAMVADAAAAVTSSGRIVSWDYEVWGQGHTARPGRLGKPGLLAAGDLAVPWPAPSPTDPDPSSGGGTTRNAVPIYTTGHRHVVGHRLLRSPIRSSSLRALGAYFNVFAVESLMDELASAIGHDPLAFRLAHLDDDRGRAVLRRAAAGAGWGAQLPPAVGRGIGFARYKDIGAYCAVVAEVEVVDTVRVRRLTLAADVGEVVNPDGARNQLEGGAIQATSWTTKERVRFDHRQVTSQDWESYPILRFSEVPDVHVDLVDRPGLPSLGAGEAAQGPTAGAIANAVAAALDIRVRRLPITADAVVSAIELDGS